MADLDPLLSKDDSLASDGIESPLVNQFELFKIDSEEVVRNLKGVREFGIPVSKIIQAVSKTCRDEVLRSLEAETRPTDKFSERNILNDLSGRLWIQETKSTWHQKGIRCPSPTCLL